MTHQQVLVGITVLVALCFDFFNGFHDAANSIATIVSTRVLTPRVAVFWAAAFNFLAAFVMGIAVAKTIGTGMIDLRSVTQYVVLAGLFGAIIWDIITWWFGLPTSSSHALIGGYAGAAIARGGFKVIIPHGWTPTLTFIVLSPLVGFILALLLMVATIWIARRRTPRQVDKTFRLLQIISSAATSFGHGANDAQKTMGLVAGALFTGGYMTAREMNGNWGRFHWPIIFACYTMMGIGTYFGGWRIVNTMGQRITKLKPVGGFCAETSAAITMIMTALWGIPISTTHTITGAIVGVGSTHRFSAVRWGVARRIVWAWILTIPASALVAAVLFWIIQLANPAA